jgi:hypothetical protein
MLRMRALWSEAFFLVFFLETIFHFSKLDNYLVHFQISENSLEFLFLRKRGRERKEKLGGKERAEREANTGGKLLRLFVETAS